MTATAPPGTPATGAGPARPGPSGPPLPSPARIGAHPAVRALALFVGAVMTLAVVGLGTYAVASLMVSSTVTDTTTLTGPVSRVEAHVRGSVTVQPGADDEVRISRRSTFGFVEPKVETTLDEATGNAVVRIVCRGLTVECENHVTLLVPPDVDLELHSDHTEVAGITGEVQVTSGGGEVELRRIGGPIEVRVGGGHVLGEDLTSTNVRASAGAGAIDLTFAQPPDVVDVDAGAGRIEIQLPRGEATYRVDADAGAGTQRVAVATDPDSEHLIRARAGAGDVEVTYRTT